MAGENDDHVEDPLSDEQEECVQRQIVGEEHRLEPRRAVRDQCQAQRSRAEAFVSQCVGHQTERETIHRRPTWAHAHRAE